MIDWGQGPTLNVSNRPIAAGRGHLSSFHKAATLDALSQFLQNKTDVENFYWVTLRAKLLRTTPLAPVHVIT